MLLRFSIRFRQRAPAALRFFCITLSVLIPVPRTADAQQPALLEPQTRWEQWLDQVPRPASGGIIVGIMSSNADVRLDPRYVEIRVPLRTEGPLCLELNSRDGRYMAHFDYVIGNAARRGSVRLHLRSFHETKLRRYRVSEVAILARHGGRCSDTTGQYIPAAWRGSILQDSTYVLVNSRVPTDVIGGSNGREQYRVRCLDLPGVSFSFNLRCAMPSAWIVPGIQFFIQMREGTARSSIDLPFHVH